MTGLVRLTYDWGLLGDPPGPGCYLRGKGVRGPSKQAYLIVSARRVKSEINRGRWALLCERLPAADIPDGAPLYPIIWYSRKRRR